MPVRSSIQSLRDPDRRLVADLRRPPHPDEVRESLAFWRRRAGSASWYQRQRRREAREAIDYWEAVLVRSERSHAGRLSAARLSALAGLRPARVRRFARRAAVIATGMMAGAMFAAIAAWHALAALLGF